MLLSRETRVNKLFKILLQVAKGRVQNRVAGRCSAPPRIDPGGDARNNPPPPFPAPLLQQMNLSRPRTKRTRNRETGFTTYGNVYLEFIRKPISVSTQSSIQGA
jgi:hypothetical protein